MKVVIAAAAMGLLLAGCSSVGTALKTGEAVKERVAETTDDSGWRVDCLYDQYKATKTCFVGGFGKASGVTSNFFQFRFVNGQGPYLYVPHDFPGRTPTVRVDDGPVLSDPARIVAAARNGKTAYVVFHVWPRGEERMTVDLDGFSEAYDRLLVTAGVR